jgi:hypothetical protein
MGYQTRRNLYGQIEEYRNRPLLVYITSLRPNASGQMASDVISHFVGRMQKIEPRDDVGVDLLVVSQGGDPIVAWRLATLLRERFGRYHVLLPYTAYSAATLLALGADSITMHPFANLGPVDPQIQSVRVDEGKQPQISQFPFADLTYFLAFVRENVGITDQRELQKAFETLSRSVPALEIGAARRSSHLMLSLGEKLLALHMDDKNETRSISESLNKSFYHHGYSLGRSEAKELKLKVADTDTHVENLIWAVWQDMSDEMECGVPFNPLNLLYGDEDAARTLRVANTVSLPVNLPSQIVQQVYGQLLQQVNVQPVVAVPFSVTFATVEGMHGRTSFVQRGEIRGVRMPDMNIRAAIDVISQRWESEVD